MESVAAATAGKILRLDLEQLTHALAIAGSHAGGTMEYDQSGGEVKRLHNGMACCGGLRSALLAEIGLTGPPTIFEGERGILKVMSGACDIDPIVKDLQTGSENLALYHAAMKRFPVNASTWKTRPGAFLMTQTGELRGGFRSLWQERFMT